MLFTRSAAGFSCNPLPDRGMIPSNNGSLAVMPKDTVKYRKSGAVATITLNRPEKYNTIRSEMALAIDEMLASANRDNEVRVIVLEGAGDSFCAGFDFSNGLEHHQVFKEDGYDPGM